MDLSTLERPRVGVSYEIGLVLIVPDPVEEEVSLPMRRWTMHGAPDTVLGRQIAASVIGYGAQEVIDAWIRGDGACPGAVDAERANEAVARLVSSATMGPDLDRDLAAALEATKMLRARECALDAREASLASVQHAQQVTAERQWLWSAILGVMTALLTLVAVTMRWG